MSDRTRRGRGDGTLHQRAANMDTNTEGEDVTLTEFLLERIAEDEEAAKAVHRGFWNSRIALLPPDLYGHVSRQHPARVLAECEAKRRIVAEAEEVSRHERKMASMASVSYDTPTSGEAILYLLALPYADHPDYDESWRPLTP